MTGFWSSFRRAAFRAGPAPLRDGIRLALLALVARLLVCAWAAGRFPPTEDGAFYHVVATRIALGLGYTWAWPDGAVTYAAHYPVGYPALIGLLYSVFGAHAEVAMVFNAALGSVAVLAVHRVAASAAGRAGALLAGLIAALHPALLFYTAALMTEGVAAALLAICAWVAVGRRAPEERWSAGWRWVVLGVLFGVSTLVRPQLVVLAPVFAALAPAETMRQAGLRALCTTLVALTVCAPWTARNCFRLERCVFVSANGGWNLFIGAAEKATGSWVPIEAVGFPEECRDVFGEADKDICFRNAAVRRIAESPGRWVSIVPSKLATTFDYGGAPGWYLHSSNSRMFSQGAKVWLGIAETVVQRLLLIAALVALIRAPGPVARVRFGFGALLVLVALMRGAWLAYVGLVVLALLLGRRLPRHAPAALAAACVGTTIAVHSVFFGAGRYSLVCYPLLAALAGAALTPKRDQAIIEA